MAEQKKETGHHNTTVQSNTVAIDIDKLFGISSVSELKSLITPTRRHHYVVLDFDDISPESTAKKIKWYFNNDTILSPGVANSVSQIKNIVGMRLAPINFDSINEVFRTDHDAYTMLIEEFVGQSYVGRENSNYHFIMSARPYLDGGVDFDPSYYNDGWYWFREPIASVHSFTISMCSPYHSINIPMNNNIIHEVHYDNPLQFIIDNINQIETGKTVIIRGFTTNDPIADKAMIELINRPEGHEVLDMGDQGIYYQYFTIGVDGTAITAPAPDNELGSLIVINKANKVLIQLELVTEN